MEFKDYYKVLGVENDADTKTIKTAYRKLASKYHPDMNPDAGAEEKFKEIAEAYHVLKDTKLRAEFDELLKYGSRSSSGFQPPPGWQGSTNTEFRDGASFDADYSDFFNSVFRGKGQPFGQAGGQRARSARGQDVEIELPFLLEETLKITEKEIEFTLPADRGQSEPSKKHLKVKIPLGVMDGERIRLAHQGKPGFNGGAAGDLYLHIRIVPHPLFEVSGHNLLLTLPLAPWEAALGTKVTVPTLDGKVALSIPANISSGQKIRIKGKGLITKTLTGDLFAIVKITMPAQSSERAKALWQELSTSETFDPRAEWSAAS